MRLATEANALQMSAEAALKDVQRRFQAAASRPDGPAAPSILRIVRRMSGPSIVSNKTGWGSCTCVPGEMMANGFRGCFGGCFLRKASRTVSSVVGQELDSKWLSKSSGPPLLSFDISRSLVFNLPSIMSLAKVRAVCWADLL